MKKTMVKTLVKKTRKPATISKNMPLYDRRMIQVMDFVCANGMLNIKTKSEFLKKIEFPEMNLYQVKTGVQSFRPDNFKLACDVFGVDGRFFLQEKHLTMFTEGKQLSPIMQLKQAVSAVEIQLKGK